MQQGLSLRPHTLKHGLSNGLKDFCGPPALLGCQGRVRLHATATVVELDTD